MIGDKNRPLYPTVNIMHSSVGCFVNPVIDVI